jgi:hypothetical protein
MHFLIGVIRGGELVDAVLVIQGRSGLQEPQLESQELRVRAG